MLRKYIPLILMLTAGAITCIITMVREYPMLQQLILLFVVLVLFYLLGSIMKWTLDYFDRQNEKAAGEQGEVIEKDGEDQDENKSEDMSDNKSDNA